MLLSLGVFTAAGKCLGKYDQCKFKALPEQKVAIAKSAVDFHALINGEPVALVEAKSPRVMDKLGELLPRKGFEMRWMPGSSILTSLVFSKVYGFPSGDRVSTRILGCTLSRFKTDGMAVSELP